MAKALRRLARAAVTQDPARITAAETGGGPRGSTIPQRMVEVHVIYCLRTGIEVLAEAARAAASLDAIRRL